MKRLWIIITVSTLLLGCMLLPASATMKNANDAAEHLYEMGLFKGTGTDKNGNPNFDLSRIPTRAEAITMLVRLLGKEEEALAGTWKTPFLDVADWAKPYVGYAYINGLTSGTSATTFSPDANCTRAQIVTFLYRCLGDNK